VAGANAVVTAAVVVADGKRRGNRPHLSLPSLSAPLSPYLPSSVGTHHV
jgi:hypothetical protein